MKRSLLARALFKVFIACLLLVVGANVNAGINLEAIDSLPPGEQYRQLSLVLMVFAGAAPELIDAMGPSAAPGPGSADFNPDVYKTPLTRIVDQESMLNGAALLLRFAADSQAAIQARLAAIKAANPVLISLVDSKVVSEDAIIIRNAIADSISYAGLAGSGEFADQLQNYRTSTIHLRNLMEFEVFNIELERLTREAILAVGGKLDAYQRMFDEEVNATGFDRQIESAEFIYNRDAEFDEKAGKLTEEIMRNVILQESQVDP